MGSPRTLDLLIWDLAEIPHPLGACITAQMLGATNRFQTLISLATAKGRDAKTIQKISELMRKTYDVQEQRNRIVHDPWYIEAESGEPGQFKAMPFRSGLAYGMRDIDEKDILR